MKPQYVRKIYAHIWWAFLLDFKGYLYNVNYINYVKGINPNEKVNINFYKQFYDLTYRVFEDYIKKPNLYFFTIEGNNIINIYKMLKK